ncbi:hypothetical protein pb186bvf_017886 [Paramecium bursaria]
MSSSSQDEIDEGKPIKKLLTLNRKRYGQRIPKELAQLRTQVNTKYIFGEIAETKRLLEIIIQKYPQCQEAYLVYGLIHQDENNIRNATKFYILAAYKKGSPSLWLKIANLLKQQEQYDKASIYFGKVLKKNQTDFSVIWERVDCFEKSRNYSKAIAQLEKLEIMSKQLNLPDVRIQTIKRMAKIYFKKQSYEEAKKVLMQIDMNDDTLNMMCEILEIEKNFNEMRKQLDDAFGTSSMQQILKKHDYKIISFYMLCSGFNDYQPIIEHFQHNSEAINHFIDLSEKLQKQEKDKLIDTLYQYKHSYQPDIKNKILYKHALDESDQSEVPIEPAQPENRDQILYLYNKVKQQKDPKLAALDYIKILNFEQKSLHKSSQIKLIKREDYLFGKQKKRRFFNQVQQGSQSLSSQIGYEEFFSLALGVFKGLLTGNHSVELFQATYKTYQLRLKKMAQNDKPAYNNFMLQLAKYALWASLKEKKYIISPIYLRYLQKESLLMNLIQIIYKNIPPEQRGIVNSFTRSLPEYKDTMLQPKQLEKLHKKDQNNSLYNLLLSLYYLQTATGRLETQKEDMLKKSLFHFDKYRINSTDDVEVNYNLGRVYLHLNLVSKGQELMEQVLETDHELKYKAAFTLMQLHKKMGNQEQALYLLRKYNTL